MADNQTVMGGFRGDRLAVQMEARGWSAVQLAARLEDCGAGCSPAAISYWVQAVKSPGGRYLAGLCRIFGTDPDYWFEEGDK